MVTALKTFCLSFPSPSRIKLTGIESPIPKQPGCDSHSVESWTQINALIYCISCGKGGWLDLTRRFALLRGSPRIGYAPPWTGVDARWPCVGELARRRHGCRGRRHPARASTRATHRSPAPGRRGMLALRVTRRRHHTTSSYQSHDRTQFGAG